jgi:predicted HicB family RNase H-like nuclease
MNARLIEKYLRLNYPIEIRFLAEEDGGGVVASIPFLGRDAFFGDGDNLTEALNDLQDTKEMFFKDYLEKGIPIPLPPKQEDYSGKFVLRVPKFLHEQLVNYARENDVSLNTLCVSILSHGLSAFSVKESLDCIKEAVLMIRGDINRYMLAEGFPKPELGGRVTYFPEVSYGNAA